MAYRKAASSGKGDVGRTKERKEKTGVLLWFTEMVTDRGGA